MADRVAIKPESPAEPAPPVEPAAVAAPPAPFWRGAKLEDLNPTQWEQLCDGCGRCCLLKLEDETTGELFHTRLSCRLLDIGSCRCGDYENRHAKIPDCVRIDAQAVRRIEWLPDTCAYRLVAQGQDLYWWHPLVSGDPGTVHQAGVSVRGFAKSEARVRPAQFEDYIIGDAAPKPRSGSRSGARPQAQPEPKARRAP